MNLDSLSFALSHITFSVTNLSKRSYNFYVSEINTLCCQYGTEAERHLLRCLFSLIDFSSENRTKDLYQVQYLSQQFSFFLAKPNFISYFCFAFDNPLHQQKTLRPSNQLLIQVVKVLLLNTSQETLLALALIHSNNSETKRFSKQFLLEKLPLFVSSFVKSGISCLYSTELLHLVCKEISDPLNTYEIDLDLWSQFISVIKEDPNNLLLSPYIIKSVIGDIDSELEAQDLIITENIKMVTNIADALAEIGYSFTKSQEHCRSCITQFGIKNLTAPVIARTIGFMVRIPSGFLDPITGQNPFVGSPGGAWPAESKDVAGGDTGQLSTWIVDNFISTIKELAPMISWKEVVKELDHSNFYVSSRASLELLVSVLKATIDPFPVDVIYTMWKNKEGQLSLINQSLKASDVLCLADHLHRPVDISCLKSLPDEENKDIATWRSFDLINILLQLAEEGLQHQVYELFKYPVTNCPDLLTLGLLQYPKVTALKQELLNGLFPAFLGSHPNSLQVLQSTWNVPGLQQSTQRASVLKCMADWYMRDQCDQSRLARVLDVAQDLKALSTLLNGSPHAFVIDLACLASRREYLKLDKWINDKMRDHGESFIEALVTFLTQRCPQLTNNQAKDDTFQMKGQQIPQELVNTMIMCLNHAVNNRAGQMSLEMSNYIILLVNNYQTHKMKLQYQNQQHPSAPTGSVGTVGPFSGRPIPSAGSSFGLEGVTGINNPQSVLPSNLLPAQTQLQQTDPLNNFNLLSNLNSFGMGVGSNPHHPMQLFHHQSSLQTPLHTTPGLPGSPAKTFGGGVQPGGSFNTGLANQLQNLNLQGNLGSALIGQNNMLGVTSIGSSSRGGMSLGSLSAQVALSQQHPQNRTGQTTLSNLGSLSNVGGGLPSLLGAINLNSMGVSNLQQQQDPFVTPASTTTQQQHIQQGQAGTAAAATFSKDIEDEANSYFQRIYNNTSTTLMGGGPLTVEEALELLKNFKNSQNPRENEIFQCMIRNLFEEYRFFAHYPDRELQTTAILFGGIIEQGLITYVALGMALRYVLEALKKPFQSKMYMFGLTALDRFKIKLKDYPQYCQFLSLIQHFHEFPPALKEYIEFGSRSMDVQHPTTVSALQTVLPTINSQSETVPSSGIIVAASSQGSSGTTSLPHPSSQSNSGPAAPSFLQTTHGAISRPPGTTVRNSIANATNIDTLLANKEGIDGVMAPTESQQDKVFFIFNNLSQSNMDQKALEMTEQVGEEFLPWVAQYLVMKRASTEPNFHTLYANFIEFLKNSNFTKMVITETYRNIKVLLRSDKVVANFSDRTLLKNLGHWLGMLLIAKNKPILQIDIDLKSLVYEAYHMGADELLYVVPFIAKIIESAAKSKVFKYPNPWTMAIMNVLGELHQEPDLKLNLKFEIEVLCKSLNVTMDLLEPDHYLKNTARLTYLERQLSTQSSQNRSQAEVEHVPQETSVVHLQVPGPVAATPQPEEMPLEINMPGLGLAVAGGNLVPSVGPTMMGTGQIGDMPQLPHFGYAEVNAMTVATMTQHIVISDQISLFQMNPGLKQLVRPAIERAVQELLNPAVDRAISIALKTSEIIIKKDFALDPDENRLRSASHAMARFMTSGMALITCQEPVLVSINTQLKTMFMSALRSSGVQYKELVDQAAQTIALDNTELATVFIQKTAIERALPEMDKRLLNDFELRRLARAEGQRFYDSSTMSTQEHLPEEIRLKIGGASAQQMAVYDVFSQNIPGFLPGLSGGSSSNQQTPYKNISQGIEHQGQLYDKMSHDIQQAVVSFVSSNNSFANLLAQHLKSLHDNLLASRSTLKDINTAVALLQRAIEGLLEGMLLLNNVSNDQSASASSEMSIRYKDCFIGLLKLLQDPRLYGSHWASKQITRCLTECKEELRFVVDAVEGLISAGLVVIPQYDAFLSQAILDAMSQQINGVSHVVLFAMQLVQRFCVESDKFNNNSPKLQEGDFSCTIEALTKVSVHARQTPEGLSTILELIRQQNGDIGLLDRISIGPSSMMHSGILQAREIDDPLGLHEKTEALLNDWVLRYHQYGKDGVKIFFTFVNQMHQHGILKTDDLITRFFRLCTEMCVDLCYRLLAEPAQSVIKIRVQCFHRLDAFVRLIVLLIKYSGCASNTSTKINLLNKILGIVAGVLLQDHEVRRTEFHQLPYHRILIMLFVELNAPEPTLDAVNFEILQAFCNVLHILRPAKAPGFAFAWLEIVSHRVFVGKTLVLPPQQKAWGMYAQLLVDLFRFFAPFIRNAELSKPTQLLYKGMMRVLLVLLHDFPELLCDYHYAFCDVIPTNGIQIRNLVLSAFPRSMRLPDPFTPNLKVDLLPDISSTPRIMTKFSSIIQPVTLKKDLDSYLKSRSPVTFLSELRGRLQISNMPGMKYNISLMNSIVLYVGTQAINQIQQKQLIPNMGTIAHSSHMDIFQNLAVDLDTEGRYLFLNAMANQLRYPNSHTHYFSCTLLYLFAEANQEVIQEQITRVLLERLLVNRPHPWGLLVTFIELIKNPQFKFWNHDFVHCAPEIEKLLESVARSCVQMKTAQSSNLRDNESETR